MGGPTGPYRTPESVTQVSDGPAVTPPSMPPHHCRPSRRSVRLRRQNLNSADGHEPEVSSRGVGETDRSADFYNVPTAVIYKPLQTVPLSNIGAINRLEQQACPNGGCESSTERRHAIRNYPIDTGGRKLVAKASHGPSVFNVTAVANKEISNCPIV